MKEPTLRWSLATTSAPDAPPEEPTWMTPDERKRLWFSIEKRRRQYLLGRLTAKRLVADSYLERCGQHLSLASIEIGVEPSGAPCVRLPGGAAAPGLSISHSGNAAFCAVLWGDGTVGADVEQVEPRSEAFVHDFFAPEEVIAWAQAPRDRRDQVAGIIWSAKESALKALKLGLTVDTRHVVCVPERLEETVLKWRPLTVRLDDQLGLAPGLFELPGVYGTVNGFVLTLAFLVRGGAAVVDSVRRQLQAAPPLHAGGPDGQVPATAS